MSFLRHTFRNWADTAEPGDPAPVDLPLPLPEAVERVRDLLAKLPHWRVEAVDVPNGTVKATRRTRLCKFVDDITIRLEALGGSTRVHARSQSRVGLVDFGQNRRNLLELLTALR